MQENLSYIGEAPALGQCGESEQSRGGQMGLNFSGEYLDNSS